MTKYDEMVHAYALQKSICDYSPLHVYIEPTNKCNLSCSHCPVSRDKSSGGCMDYQMYKDLIHQISEMGVEWVYLFHCGEPMLHPDIAMMVEYARSFDLKVRMHTNGTHDLSDVACKIDELYISVNETPLADVYETIEGLLDDAVDNKFYDYPLPVQFYDHRENEHNWRCAAGMSNHPREKRCSQTYKTFVVGWDGRCLACCADSDRLAVIGDATQESLQDIWNGEEMQVHRTAPQKWCNYCTMKDTVNDAIPEKSLEDRKLEGFVQQYYG